LPIPPPAPVTIATLSFSLRSILSLPALGLTIKAYGHRRRNAIRFIADIEIRRVLRNQQRQTLGPCAAMATHGHQTWGSPPVFIGYFY